jgi:hypothetical protein
MRISREVNEINKHYGRYQRGSGETIIWYEFDLPVFPDFSFPSPDLHSELATYDDVYDEGRRGEGGRNYNSGIVIPVLLITETEDLKRSIPEGRQVTQVVNFIASYRDFAAAGISEPYEYRHHLNDIFQYDGRYYSVTTYRVRGRARDDLMIVVEGIELYLDQEFVNDPHVGGYVSPNLPWPETIANLG